jgi:hypothetical protein
MSYPALASATVRCCDIAWIGHIRNAKVVGSTPALGNHLKALLEQSFGFYFFYRSKYCLLEAAQDRE